MALPMSRSAPLWLDPCDRILSFLPVYFGMSADEVQKRVGGESPNLALDRMVFEGLVVWEIRRSNEPRRYRFAFGAKWAWDALVLELYSKFAASGRAMTLDEFALRPWSRPGWLVRAFYRLWRLGWIEREGSRSYRIASNT